VRSVQSAMQPNGSLVFPDLVGKPHIHARPEPNKARSNGSTLLRDHHGVRSGCVPWMPESNFHFTCPVAASTAKTFCNGEIP
jgi:hypothetical protein